MNFKNLSLGLALTGLGVISLSMKADAYSFNYLGSSSASGGNTNFDFEFGVNPGDTFSPSSTLAVAGFQGISGGSTFGVTTPNPDPNGATIPAPFFFQYSGSNATNDTAYFTIPTGFAGGSAGTLYFQTFRVTAASVPSSFVYPNFGGAVPGQPGFLDPTPVPEPLTILGSMAALGFASRCQKEFAKKQSANSEGCSL
jgi:hypothetical protein